MCLGLFFAGLSGCKEDTNELAISCNGNISQYCNHKYNEHTYAGTHNSFAYTPVYNDIIANQRRSITQQLQDGIRCLNLDVYLLVGDTFCADSAIYVYHQYPGFGCQFFTDVLSEVKSFIDANSNEVVTITIEDTNLDIVQLSLAFSQANLTGYQYHKQQGEPWATLGQMIQSNKRLVVFADVSNPNQTPGFFRNWNYIFDNPYSAENRYDFSCSLNRGNTANDLFLLNHFITVITPRPDSATVVNTRASLAGHIEDCKSAFGRIPNFIYVDFYDVGDVLSVTDSLNRAR
ncbi:hypothetical protein C7N43_17135 [Sphingobacteriales bacterium UPWRP_1]|nr:hypothetical protein C7N43_17135 [Sphingobacteriales bacterium UPWRP_1]